MPFHLSRFWREILPFFCLASVVTFAVREHFFFWDTVQLASKHAHFFYETNFNSFLLPDEMDSGHPPFFGFGLALCWKWFGKSLVISHLYMLPFLFLLITESWLLAEKVIGENKGIIFLITLWASPIFASQAILVSPDIALCSFFIMSLNGILRNQNVKFAIAALGLSMISLRGMMVLFTLFIFFCIKNLKSIKNEKLLTIIQKFTPFIFGGLLGIAFLSWHYVAKGWIGYFSGSSWAESFEKVDVIGMLKNTIIVIWRLLDFGHLFLWFVLIVFIWKKKITFRQFFQNDLLLLLLLTIIFLTPTAIRFVGLNGHRYFLPIYIVLILCFLKVIENKKLIFGVIIALFSGNFWVYPQPIATGWDSTLAHLPYYDLRQKMMQYIDTKKLDIKTIGTSFPNWDKNKWIDLNDDERQFAKKDLLNNAYIFYSNIFNDFSAEELQTLRQYWKVEQVLRGGQIEVILYKKEKNNF